MVVCPKCGAEPETRTTITGAYITGCWQEAHREPLHILGEQLIDLWPMCGFARETQEDSIKSWEEWEPHWKCDMEVREMPT